MLPFELSKLKAELFEELILEIVYDYHDVVTDDNKDDKRNSEKEKNDDFDVKPYGD